MDRRVLGPTIVAAALALSPTANAQELTPTPDINVAKNLGFLLALDIRVSIYESIFDSANFTFCPEDPCDHTNEILGK